MMMANVRAQLGREDAQLVLRLVSRGGAERARAAEATLADQGLDPLLDDPELLRALIEARQSAHASLPLFCYVVVRHALRRTGSDSRRLADYVASVLLHFGLRERARRLSDSDDQTYDTIARIAEDVESADSERAFLARAHLGNYALWVSGLFPDHIEHRRWRRGGPDLGYYESMGQRGFRLAADHRLANRHGLAPLYVEAAQAFPKMRRALNAVSDSLLFRHVHTPERLMRQVRDAFDDDRLS
jgi:hypothetical protein